MSLWEIHQPKWEVLQIARFVHLTLSCTWVILYTLTHRIDIHPSFIQQTQKGVCKKHLYSSYTLGEGFAERHTTTQAAQAQCKRDISLCMAAMHSYGPGLTRRASVQCLCVLIHQHFTEFNHMICLREQWAGEVAGVAESEAPVWGRLSEQWTSVSLI